MASLRHARIKRFNWIFISGSSLFSLGLILTISKTWLLELLMPPIILKPNTALEEFWRKYPLEVPTKVYVFNWTNFDDNFQTSRRPKLEELGPYVFQQTMEKINIVWNDNHTVTYNQVRTWRFDEEQSEASLSDNVTTLNIISASIAHKIRYWSYLSKLMISPILSAATTRYLTTTSRQILVDGYTDMLSDLLYQLSFLAPEVPQFDKLAFLRFRNGSADFEGVFNIADGTDGNFDVINWNYGNETKYYESPCSKVHGTAGELNSPKKSRNDVGVFYADVCRNILFEYEKDVVIDGITGYKYSVGNKMLDNGTLIPENRCFCTGECMPSGMLNATGCRYGLPLFISLPHYYGADPMYLNTVEGLNPAKEKHETYIILEPETGLPLKAMLRIQLNFLIHPIEDIQLYQDVPEIYFPVIWLEMEINLPAHLASSLKMLLSFPLILNIICSILIMLGLCLVIFAVISKLYFTVLYKKVPQQNRPLPLKPEEVPL